MRIRRSVHDKISVPVPNRTYLSTPCPVQIKNKLPLLIKGKVALEVSKKFYSKSPRVVEVVVASAGETDRGLVRDYNEDKFCIVQDSENKGVFLFAIYDGHGGARCSEFLQGNLHKFILEDSELVSDTKNVMLRSFIKAENVFIEEAKRSGFDRSGSCAIVCVVVKDKCFVANVGDSRAVLSSNKGGKVFALSKDHKPADEGEMNRIVQAGGYVYQNSNYNAVPAVIGPHRVFPGRLSVSRTIGDIHAKLAQYGGNSNVIVPTPEIKHFRITNEHDFIIMCSDGIFDRLDNQKVVDCVWESFRETFSMPTQQRCIAAAKKVIQAALDRKSTDNVTVIIIAFSSILDN